MTKPQHGPGGFPVVGIIGGGQLARMCAAPAAELGITLSVLAEAPGAAAALVVPSAPVGDHRDVETVREFARECDVVTFDHEHVPADVLAALEADGVPLHPSPSALVHAQDKLAMRRRLTDLGVPCPRWTEAHTRDDVEAFGAEVGWPVVVKTPRGGYDGKGVRVVEAADTLTDWLHRAAAEGTGLLLEEQVSFTRELAVLVARSPSGQTAAWPVVETVQTDGVCTEVLAPAPGLGPDEAATATEAALRIAGALDVTGVMAVELFEVDDERRSLDSSQGAVPGSSSGGLGDQGARAGLPGGPRGRSPRVIVNELAMRPHNSGHWSMDGAVTGQFEQHLRAVLDLPLGSPAPLAPHTVMANVLGGDHAELYTAYRHIMARDPGLKVHVYGKDVRPGRKIGHVNVSGDDLAGLRERAGHAADYLRGVITE